MTKINMARGYLMITKGTTLKHIARVCDVHIDNAHKIMETDIRMGRIKVDRSTGRPYTYRIDPNIMDHGFVNDAVDMLTAYGFRVYYPQKS